MLKAEVYSSEAVANYFIEKAACEGKPITHLKLQKLLYFAQGWSLAWRNGPIFESPIYAWKYGPVIRPIYHKLKGYGGAPLTAPIGSLSHARIPAGAIADTRFLDGIYEIYKEHDATKLVELTHEQGTPWRDIYEEYKSAGQEIPSDFIIPQSQIKAHFKGKLEAAQSGGQ